MIGPKSSEGYDLTYQRAAMAALVAERKRIGMPILDMEEKSGVSMNSLYAWQSGVREPTLGCLVAVAQTFGFDVVMVRKSPTNTPDCGILPTASERARLQLASNSRGKK
ncbi:hypothetical protein [Mesorhizobium sp. M0129]|uniref:helix-turn-helix domain-containing protein n=1 Tax=Mesorhizobium sp. M0129 TaxID=2956886 RepID=UPI00333A581E